MAMNGVRHWTVLRCLGGLLTVAVSVLAAGCASPARHTAAGASRSPSARPSSRPASPVSPTPARDASPSVIAVPPPPGNLHQTRAFPSASTAVFHAEMTDLWDAVMTGNADPAVQAFFPLSAYEQVKAIADPAADWRSRLLGGFRLDVAAAHRYVGRGATLVRVIVPAAQAAWIDPGVCYNSVGYWHVAGSRIVYRQRGQLRSIGIASLISWRGLWYVVHFGTVLRNGAYGVVDAPSVGTGTPGPPGGC
ncbi:MAG TPA: hypothetical protein VKS82_16010 [Streptosporangiaceae bacterium]|nr:hypothetical protein [Streptosporangiaceae bacterium]